MPIKKIFVILILVLIGACIFYIVSKTDFFTTILGKNRPQITKPTDSPFENINNDHSVVEQGSFIPENLSPDVEATFASAEEKLAFQYGFGLIPIVSIGDWDHIKTPIIAKIDNYDAENQSLQLTVVTPQNAQVFGSQISVALPTDCTTKNTFLTDETTLFTTQGIDFKSELSVDRYLTSFCTDAECTGLNKLCKISYYSDRTGGEPIPENTETDEAPAEQRQEESTAENSEPQL